MNISGTIVCCYFTKITEVLHKNNWDLIHIPYSLDISLYNIMLCSTQHNASKVKLPTHERHPYLALMGELWMSFMRHLEKSDRKILGVHRNDKSSHKKS